VHHSNRSTARLICVLLPLLAAVAAAAELKPEARQAWEKYVRLTEARHDQEQKSGSFLWLHRLPEAQRKAALERLRRGETVIESLDTRENGRDIKAEDALIHHWIGTAFIPGVTLKETVTLIQDYENHPRYYAPEVEQARILKREGDVFDVFIRFRKKKVITVVVNTLHRAVYGSVSPTRAFSRSQSTRTAEVEDPGEKTEREKPPHDQQGFLWAINSYWRFEERDGGVYVECEALSLTRDVPTGLRWLIGPFIKSIPRESLQFTMEKTRAALVNR
jgi:hypothetical protein